MLYESASGFALFEKAEAEEIALPEIQKSVLDAEKFSKLLKLKAFLPFTSAENALENANAISEGVITESLRHFLEQNVSSGKKASTKTTLGVSDGKLAASIQEELGYSCDSSSRILEWQRGIRIHFTKFIKGLSLSDLDKAQLGLSHSYSRSKVKFNVNRIDNMVIQAIALVDQLDKDLNTFAMRCKEWYGWHFPELAKIVTDNYKFARIATIIKNRSSLTEDLIPSIEEVVEDEDIAQHIFSASRASMGTDISEIDLANIMLFAQRVISLSEYRRQLYEYLCSKMNTIAPNLTALIGEQVGARLISHAGSLTNLAKYPASTVQILGAEKALFRALKTKSNTPKYGLIFNSSFIGKAGSKNKGRISRYLANKCSIASRIDCFSEAGSSLFGERLKDQVEERLKFYETGAVPRKNVDVMTEAMKEFKELTQSSAMDEDIVKASPKKRKADDMDVDKSEDEDEDSPKKKEKKSKKEKKEKKEKKDKKEKKEKKKKKSEGED